MAADEITVCPACDDAGIRRRHPDTPVGRDATAKWRCKACGHRFAEPATRRPQQESPPRGLAGELAAADTIAEALSDD